MSIEVLKEVNKLFMRWYYSIKCVIIVLQAMMSSEFKILSMLNWLLGDLHLERIQSIPYLRNYYGARDVAPSQRRTADALGFDS